MFSYLEQPYKPISFDPIKKSDAIIVLSSGITQIKQNGVNRYQWGAPNRFFSGVNLLKKEKNVIIIPNIDSYDSFEPSQNWFKNLSMLNQYSKFYIWSKTRQIYDWMDSLNINNNYYLNFLFYQPKTKTKNYFIEPKTKLFINNNNPG